MAETTSVMRVGDLVGVRPHPTVVRLDDLEGEGAGWITESYCLTEEVRRHLEALRALLERPAGCGIFLIGQYGSGKSHFLAWVTARLREGALGAEREAVPVSLVNYPASTRLEAIVGEALKLISGGPDRRAAWSKRFPEGGRGAVLMLDELSEFLRAKPDPRSFNEDVRFLQFMGEWAQGRPFWPIAAVQEQIEHMGDLEHGSYRKIKDRYPIRMLLTPAHVRDLVGRSILIKKEGYKPAVEALAAKLREAFPGSAFSVEDFCALYPLHPATLDLLEEVRDRFSAARGVVDFAVTQIAGDPARGVAPFLEEPFGSLISPDRIVDHFQDLFEIQPEFLPLAQQVLPWYREHLAELFTAPGRRELAARVVKLLVLTHLSASRDGLAPREAAHWLLFRGTRLDPRRNLETVDGILRTLAEEGRYVARRTGRYHLDLKDDGGAALEREIAALVAELDGKGEEVFEIIAPLLGAEGLNPLGLPRGTWQSRNVCWHFHERPYAVFLGDGEPPPPGGTALCVRLPWGDAAAVPGAYTLAPARIAVGREHLELGALVRVRERQKLSPQAAERVRARIEDRLGLLRTQVRNAYLEATLTSPLGTSETPPRVEPSDTTAAWLERIAEWMLRRTYPAFEKFAPTHGPLPLEAYRRFMGFAAAHDLTDPDADDFVQIVREGYLVPMGLLQRKGRGYAVPSRPERHELVRLVLPLLEHHPAPRLVYEHLANPVYGLVPDQAGVLLAFLQVIGAIEIQKGGKSYRETCDLLPNPVQHDRIVPGRALSAAQIQSLQQLCKGLGIPVAGGWSVPEQRRALAKLRELAVAERQRLGAFLVKLETLRQQGELLEKVRCMLSHWRCLEKSDNLFEASEQLLYEIGSVGGFLGLHEALRKLPERLEALLGEVERIRHLFGRTMRDHCLDMDLLIRIEALGEAPALDQVDELEKWLGRARALYEQYKAKYTGRHDAWWRALETHPIRGWRPPAVARSRHLGLAETLAALDETRRTAEARRCRGLVNLDFQPVCTCGFDGDRAPTEAELKRFEELRERIESALRVFFRQDSVRARLRAWTDEGHERNAATQAYLEGRADVPEIANVELFDRHLAGIELVKEVDIEPVLALLAERPWERSALVAAFDELLGRHGAARLRFRGAGSASASPLPAWCAEQAVRHGVGLPAGLTAAELEEINGALRPEWFGEAALDRLEDLGLPEAAADRAAGWLLEGRIAPAPGERPPRSALIAAVVEVLVPTTPRSPREFAALAACLYGCHQRMSRIGGERWLERLDQLAGAPVVGDLPPLVEALRRFEDHQWVLLDALGLALLPMLEENVEALFAAWRPGETAFAAAGAETTTDGCYGILVRAGFDRAFEKVNAVDAMLHERFLPFDDLDRFAAAELHLACKTLVPKLDRSRPVLLFADHGFRMARDGRSWVHGGPSALERVVPLLPLAPR